LVVAVVLALVSVGCGASSAGGQTTTGGSANTDAPVSVTDVRGETVELPRPPERIVITSYRYVLDELALFGVAPVGYGAYATEALAGWSEEALAELGATPQRLDLTDGLNREAVVALEPDVIIASEYEADAFANYEQLAPLVVVDDSLDLDGDRIRMLGELLGQQERAEQLVASMDDGFDDVLATEEEIALVFLFLDGKVQAAVEFGDAKGREGELLTRLGLNVRSNWPVEPNEYGYGVIAEENFDVLEADMVWNLAPYPGDFERDKDTLLSSPVLRRLDVYRRGDVTLVSADLSQSMSFWTPLATPTLVAGVNDILRDRPSTGE
jgi:iron complex transport system substrate-binding protein